MPPTLPFWIAFAATVVFMVGALVSGLRRQRRYHLVLGPLTMVALAIAIVLTEELASHYDFPADIKHTHLMIAKTGGLLALPVIVTGLWLWRSESARGWHRACVYLWIVAVLSATASGLWMFSAGTPK